MGPNGTMEWNQPVNEVRPNLGGNPMRAHDAPHPLQADTAAPETPCMNLSRLQVGDVLLFQGQERTSRMIAAGSADATEDVRYDHAAIVIDRFSWLEATRTGIGYHHPLLTKIEEHSATYRYLHRLEPGQAVAALRHPSFNAANAGHTPSNWCVSSMML
jgi:hypothetical protein